MQKIQSLKWKVVLPLSILLFSVTVYGQNQLVRGPYLNSGTPTSMVVRWRTAQAEVGKLIYGTDQQSLSDTLVASGSETDHEFLVNGLQSGTDYFYRVAGEDTIYTPADSSFYFRTSPISGTATPTRIWAIGDFGNGSQAQLDVKTGYTEHFGDVHTDIWMWLGDNAYGDGTDQEYQEKVFEVYPEVFKNSVVWPTPGNHDYGSIDFFNNGPYYDIMTLPTNGEAGGLPSGEEGYYSFDYGNIHFLSLNTEYLLWIALPGTGFQDWLEQDLQNTTADWIICFFHQPAYSKGSHDSDDFGSRPVLMRQNVLPLLEEYGVDMVLNGHSHSYERSYLINGHYGTSDTWDPSTMLIDGTNGNPNDAGPYEKYQNGMQQNVGAVYSVVGCSGQKGSGNSPLNHPVMYMSTEDYHGSMVIDIDSLVLNAKFIDTTGAVLDEFAIVKLPGESSTGISYNTNSQTELTVYPNPFRDEFKIDFKVAEKTDAMVKVMTVEGSLLDRFVFNSIMPNETKSITYRPKSIPSNGILLVEIQTGSGISTKRLVRVQ
ncbi:MAG: hypothetical protein RL266_881 [Bacteroidota bacterium]